MGTLYDDLGVHAGATTAELRQAYRRRARELHPDVHPGDEGGAAEAMTRLNAAWRVLSDPEARRRYDLDLALAAAQARAARMAEDGSWRPIADAEVAPESGEVVGRAGHRPRSKLWALILVVLAGIFVFTAYAADRPSTSPRGGQAGQCLTAVRGLENYVPCTQPNVGRLVTEVSTDEPCPSGSFRHLLLSRNRVACLTRS